MWASRWTSTNAPTREASPTLHPYRLTKGPSCTSAPRITSGATETFGGNSRSGIAIVVVLSDAVGQRERDRLPVIFEGTVGRFEDFDDAQSAQAVAVGGN